MFWIPQTLKHGGLFMLDFLALAQEYFSTVILRQWRQLSMWGFVFLNPYYHCRKINMP